MTHLHHAALGSPLGSVLLSLLLIFIGGIYLRGWLPLRSDDIERISAWRPASFFIGLFLIWLAVASPIARLDHELLTVHMLQHLLLMTVAPPLIWLGAPTRPVLYGLPRVVKTLLAPLWQSQTAKGFAEFLVRPKFALLAACVALVGWHVPRFFALGMQSSSWHLFEHSSFLATGLLFWWPVLQRSAGSRQDVSMILYLFLATLPCDLLSGFLVFSDRVAYPMYFSSSHLLGFTPLVDQQCAAALMWTCVTVVYFVAGGILTVRLLSPQIVPQAGLVRSKLSGVGIPPSVSQGLEAF